MDGPGSTWKTNDVYDAYPNDPKNRSGTGPLGLNLAPYLGALAGVRDARVAPVLLPRVVRHEGWRAPASWARGAKV